MSKHGGAFLDLDAIQLLPEISLTKPDSFEPVASVSVRRLEKMRSAIILACAILPTSLISGFIVPMPTFIGISLIGFLGALALAMNVIANYNRLKRDPVMLVIYTHGLWFSEQAAFFPYEKLLKFSQIMMRERRYSVRLGWSLQFKFLLTSAESRLSCWSVASKLGFTFQRRSKFVKISIAQLKGMSDAEVFAIYQLIGETASKYLLSNGRPPPEFNYDDGALWKIRN